MDFPEKLKEFIQRITIVKDNLKTEEATKTSLILPFIHMLGYDIFNPVEVIPEFTADVGIKKGEKVDYAIMQNNQPIILIETKECNTDLNSKNLNQLYRYFTSTKAKFGILTNGIIYKFYSDLDEPNIMDSTPFLEVDLLNITNKEILELNRFSKDVFDIKSIINSASELKYKGFIKKTLIEQLQNPSDSIVKAILSKDIYGGVKTQNVIDKFKPIIRDSFNEYVNELINNKLQVALDTSNLLIKDKEYTELGLDKSKNYKLTDLELETLNFLKNILKDTIDENSLIFKKTEKYACIQVGDNVRRWICRIYITQNKQTFILHKFENETYEDTYYYTDYQQLNIIKDLIIQVAKMCKNS